MVTRLGLFVSLLVQKEMILDLFDPLVFPKGRISVDCCWFTGCTETPLVHLGRIQRSKVTPWSKFWNRHYKLGLQLLDRIFSNELLRISRQHIQAEIPGELSEGITSIKIRIVSWESPICLQWCFQARLCRLPLDSSAIHILIYI
jgi:hypothetical protein